MPGRPLPSGATRCLPAPVPSHASSAGSSGEDRAAGAEGTPAVDAECGRPPSSVWRWVAIAASIGGIVVLTALAWHAVRTQPPVADALAAGSVAALATALGTLPVLLARRLSERVQDTLFGFGAGVMLAASAFSLVIPGLQAVRTIGAFGGGPWAAALVVGAAIRVGAGALLAAGYRRAVAAGLGIASGLLEPVGAVAGAAAVTYSAVLLPWGLGFAAGAMLFVISHEIIPESHRKGHESFATAGVVVGFVLLMMLDTALA